MTENTGLPPRRADHSRAWLLAGVAALLVLFSPIRPIAQGNPFFNAPAPMGPSTSMRALSFSRLVSAQHRFRELLAEAVGRTAAGSAGVLPLLGLAFLYGLLHALGPGHRKVALSAYFLARPARLSDGVKAGAAVALLHAVSAMAIVYGLYYLLKLSVSVAFSSISSTLELSSYAAIALIGLVLLALAVRGWLREARLRATSGEPDLRGGEGKTLAAIVVGSGAVPCPGAALVLIFCLAQQLPWIGALAVLAMSLGMAVVTVSVSLATVLGKHRLFAVLPAGGRVSRLLHHLLEAAGALLLIAFGLFMLSPYMVGFLR